MTIKSVLKSEGVKEGKVIVVNKTLKREKRLVHKWIRNES